MSQEGSGGGVSCARAHVRVGGFGCLVCGCRNFFLHAFCRQNEPRLHRQPRTTFCAAKPWWHAPPSIHSTINTRPSSLPLQPATLGAVPSLRQAPLPLPGLLPCDRYSVATPMDTRVTCFTTNPPTSPPLPFQPPPPLLQPPPQHLTSCGGVTTAATSPPPLNALPESTSVILEPFLEFPSSPPPLRGRQLGSQWCCGHVR